MLLCPQVVALSDLFTERQQYVWMLESLMEVQRTHPVEDELVAQYIVVGVCKAVAVVGLVSEIMGLQGSSSDWTGK